MLSEVPCTVYREILCNGRGTRLCLRARPCWTEILKSSLLKMIFTLTGDGTPFFGECNLFKGNPELCQAQLQDEDVLSEFLQYGDKVGAEYLVNAPLHILFGLAVYRKNQIEKGRTHYSLVAPGQNKLTQLDYAFL